MLHLNILPKSQKKEIKLKLLFVALKNLFAFIVILLILYIITFLAVKLMLQMHFVDTIEETTLVTKSTQNYSKQVHDINIQIDAVDTIQNKSTNWSYLLEFLSKGINNDIALSGLAINRTNDTIILSGFAGSRQSLLELNEQLENSGIFENINFPISNILEKDNINFEIGAKFSTYEFEKITQN